MNTVIIGGGISGLSLAHHMRVQGQDVLLLEAERHVGGTIQSEGSPEGYLTEAGPNGFLDREPATRALVAALGLEASLRPASPAAQERFVFTRGRLRRVPHSPLAFLRSDILPCKAKLRLAAEPFSSRSRTADESLASFARRHVGERATQVLVDAMQSGIFAGDSERLSVSACFPRMAELEREHRSLVLALLRLQKAARRARGPTSSPAPSAAGPSGRLLSLEGGLATLPQALARSLGRERIRVGTRLQSVEKTATGYHLAVSDTDGAHRITTSRLVLATPAYVSAQLLRPLDPALAEQLEAIAYAPIAAVHLGFAPDAFSPAPQGFGFLVPFEERRRLLGTLYISSLFPWRAPSGAVLLTCMVGGARQPSSVRRSDEDLVDLVRDELAAILGQGLGVVPHFTKVVRWPQGIPQYEVGHAQKLSSLQTRLGHHPGLFLHGNAYRGVGLNDCVRNSALLAEELAAR